MSINLNHEDLLRLRTEVMRPHPVRLTKGGEVIANIESVMLNGKEIPVITIPDGRSYFMTGGGATHVKMIDLFTLEEIRGSLKTGVELESEPSDALIPEQTESILSLIEKAYSNIVNMGLTPLAIRLNSDDKRSAEAEFRMKVSAPRHRPEYRGVVVLGTTRKSYIVSVGGDKTSTFNIRPFEEVSRNDSSDLSDMPLVDSAKFDLNTFSPNKLTPAESLIVAEKLEAQLGISGAIQACIDDIEDIDATLGFVEVMLSVDDKNSLLQKRRFAREVAQSLTYMIGNNR